MGIFGFLFNTYKNNKKINTEKDNKPKAKPKASKLSYDNFDEKKQYLFLDCIEQGIQKKLTEEEITKLSEECQKQLGNELPEDFKTFLGISNGFYGEGVRVLGLFKTYVIETTPKAEEKTFDILKWHDIGWEWSDQYIILGIDSISYIGYDVINKRYVYMDRSSMDVFAESQYFSLLLAKMLKANNILDDEEK